MLTLDRRINECVYIGETKILVKDIKNRSVFVDINGKEIRIKHGQSIMIGETEVLLSEYFNHKVRIGFDGPRTVTILRGELKNKNEQHKYINNATKQFPSGEF